MFQYLFCTGVFLVFENCHCQLWISIWNWPNFYFYLSCSISFWILIGSKLFSDRLRVIDHSRELRQDIKESNVNVCVSYQIGPIEWSVFEIRKEKATVLCGLLGMLKSQDNYSRSIEEFPLRLIMESRFSLNHRLSSCVRRSRSFSNRFLLILDDLY